METKLEEFGFNYIILIKRNTCDYHGKYHNDVRDEGNVKMYFTHIFQMTLLIMQILHVNKIKK